MASPVTFNFDQSSVLKGVMTTSLQDWSGFFEFLRYQQYQKLSLCTSEEQRIEIQQSVKGLIHVEGIFRRMHETKKFT